MIYRQKLRPKLKRVGLFRSAIGGAAQPYRLERDEVFVELVTEGVVNGFDDGLLHGSGSIFLHKPGEHTIWKTESTSYYTCLFVIFTIQGTVKKDAWPRVWHWQDQRAALVFADEVLRAYSDTGIDRTSLSDFIWAQVFFREQLQQRSAAQAGIPRRIAAAMAYVDEHFASPINIDDIAAHVGLSVSHLHARFRDCHGQTPHQYLIQSRMRAAGHLLLTTDSPIKAIAANVGYANAESFCRAFKKHYADTAASYRSRHRSYD